MTAKTRRLGWWGIAALSLAGAVLIGVASAASAAPPSVTLTAANGATGGGTGTEHGSDQGEDQGENIDKFARGSKKIGPTAVTATNSTASGSAQGGAGGSIRATFENHIVTTCGTAPSHVIPMPETVDFFGGRGGKGGSSGTLQGEDQGEDQGENIGQHAFKSADVSTASVIAMNTNKAGPAPGGSGGNVTIVFHNVVTCVAAGTAVQHITPAPPSVEKDSHGNIRAVYTAETNCGGAPPAHYVIRAGNGGNGGRSGHEQGTDQGEDQGENIGQWSSGGTRGGPATVTAHNTLTSAEAIGGVGGTTTVTFENTIDLTCADKSVALAAGSPIRATGGTGGAAGLSGSEQGSDQGEDQGENIGKDAKDGARIGPVRVSAQNLNVSGDASGGAGGSVHVTYSDTGTCSSPPTTQLDERVAGKGGTGGKGGKSGEAQGSDQGEDQGENIGQYAKGRVYIGSVSVLATNTNQAGAALGGGGGAVTVAYSTDPCAPAASSRSQRVDAAGGHGGGGGASGHEQGADQGEDQGENIGQHASNRVTFGHITVHATNLNASSDANGGTGGDVVVHVGTPDCATPSSSTELRVRSHPGTGGAGGTTGKGQGSDQGEDQGENIGANAKRGAGKGHTSVSAKNDTHVGKANAGELGHVKSFVCTGKVVRRLAHVSTGNSASVQPFSCTKTFGGTVRDLIVPPKTKCILTSRARVIHSVEVDSDGMLISNGAFIGKDVSVDGAQGIRVIGGTVGHDLAIEATKGRAAGGNAVCGVKVGHDLAVADSTRESGVFTVGGISGCPGNTVNHDLAVQANVGGAMVARNTAGHFAECEMNASLKGGANRAPKLNTCPKKKL